MIFSTALGNFAPYCLASRVGISGAVRGKRVITTIPDPSAPRAPDLVDRDFVASAPNRCWVADFTHVATFSGVVYVAFVVDTFSRRIVGWSASTTKQTRLVLDALDMGLWQRDPTNSRPFQASWCITRTQGRNPDTGGPYETGAPDCPPQPQGKGDRGRGRRARGRGTGPGADVSEDVVGGRQVGDAHASRRTVIQCAGCPARWPPDRCGVELPSPRPSQAARPIQTPTERLCNAFTFGGGAVHARCSVGGASTSRLQAYPARPVV
ncbi:DDE-type integrase/transposase/recombinase [Streptomyces wuyuanensis]|uniref:DDE-type integrase/transposase/recombinase n=1 Tax=Streptomyces wuyuanensis TaxID=1196353 RepID=UPI00380539C4